MKDAGLIFLHMYNNFGSKPVLVVGAGPAGSSCAWKLASGGVRCILADKSLFPRDKVCGGVLGSRGESVLLESGLLTADELEDLTLAEYRGFSLWHRDVHLRTHFSEKHSIRMVSRSDFDKAMLDKAADAGARIETGTGIKEISTNEAITFSGEKLPFYAVVGADGCGSVVSRVLPDTRGRNTGIGFCYSVPRSGMDELPQLPEIHFGDIPYGYIWVFPDSDKVNIGAGAIGSPAAPSDVIGALGSYLKDLNVSEEGLQIKGASIPSLSISETMGQDNIYLAGDAAGLVDQVSGEGICYALQSGLAVAECLLEGGDREIIRNRMRESMGILKQSVFYRHLLYGRLIRKLAMTGLRDSGAFAREYWNIVAGRQSYNGMFRKLLDLDFGRGP
ncbi:MAG: geranylgeranyl reductase family protein [Candidatus Aegiribacteria sp.]|nr:geranylgeranyl reductase family protein [Candidatus Aegiribacteria sp.]MBD3295635.1 geranylgeranyl reductase family protein [Candidatus Fermentibacteria bacterium]